MSGTDGRLGYQPALDGVRGIAVLAVLCFHTGFEWMSGGYVGVSVFFTLSGFLITTLAVREHAGTGSLDVLGFYGRRLRRLLPASLLCIGGVTIVAMVGAFDGAEHLRRDVLAALAQVYNWFALADTSTYGEVIGGGARFAPLDHYWSLAIEEQFYWCWPLVLVGVLGLRRRARIEVIGTVTLIAALAAPLIAWRWGGDAAYWSTPARLAEILVGATLALGLDRRRARRQRLPAATALLAPIGLVVIVVAAVTWPAQGGPAEAGWLPAIAVASGALVLGLQTDGPVRRALAHPAVVSLGVVSYGVYLYHWPVYGILDEQRTGWSGWGLFAVRFVVTVVLAVGSYVFVEEPIRQQRWTFGQSGALAAAGTVTVALVALAAPIERPGFWVGSADAREEVAIEAAASTPSIVVVEPATEATTADSSRGTSVPPPARSSIPASESTTTDRSAPPTSDAAPTTDDDDGAAEVSTTPPTIGDTSAPVTPTAAPGSGAAVPPLPATLSRPARMLVVGDSTASAVGEGLVRFAAAHPNLAQVSILWSPGCGFVRDGEEIGEQDDAFHEPCAEVHATVPSRMAELSPDVVVLMQTIADTAARSFDDGRPSIQPGDPGFDEFLRAEYERQMVVLLEAGASSIVWIVPPPQLELGSGQPVDPEAQPAVRRAVEWVAARHPDVVTVVDVAAWQEGRSDGLRPDGLHYSPNGAALLAEDLLGPVLVDLAVT